MSLPRRTHFSVFEVMARWGATITDMRCFLEAGQLQAQALLEDKLAQIYRRHLLQDGEEAWSKKGTIVLNGYVVVQPEKLRKIFRQKSATVHKFKALEGPDYYKLLREKDFLTLGIEDLWIARIECQRFESDFQISTPPSTAPDSKTGIAANAAGRPSIMKRITERYRERVACGEALPTIAAEAQVLRSWAQGAMPNIQIPSVKTIRNQLSANE